ncbi:hypothetical protein BOTBODRAFT_38383 [Botryobasidium botryosum FD-172 SS1]|uniref:Phosphatidic acid phosphatase type 2/haloperoxidase domain-containing protein n=1 Tax=Botryobasidium botryosum (strain FD-172 SS1) TaxID=930990 RepID=A0A067M8P4_BOTB1|nr:hypothetical protein BOTBODRAFT_38383 [Botryobasidium botryosum FD-172 SS1]
MAPDSYDADAPLIPPASHIFHHYADSISDMTMPYNPQPAHQMSTFVGGSPVDSSSSAPRKSAPIDNRHRLRLLLSYAPDWILCILLGGLFYLLNKIHGFWRNFSLTDTTIQFPFAVKERVPDTHLYLIAFVAPLVLMPIVNLLLVRSWWDWHISWLGLVLSETLTGSITQVVKVTVGRPRPDLIDRCQPAPGSQNAPVWGLVTSAVCTQDNLTKLKDGFRSFPSGHSSMSFAGLGFLSFYLAGKLHLFDQRGHTAKSWIAVAPLMGAALVAISRTMDYRHHWQDVLVGSLLGITVAFFAYRQYYPALSSPHSHHPFSPRIQRAGSTTHAPISTLHATTAPQHEGRGYADEDVEMGGHPVER